MLRLIKNDTLIARTPPMADLHVIEGSAPTKKQVEVAEALSAIAAITGEPLDDAQELAKLLLSTYGKGS